MSTLCLDFCKLTLPTSDVASQLQEINIPLVLSEWVRLLSHHPDKAFALLLCYYASYLANQGLAPQTVKAYMAALRSE